MLSGSRFGSGALDARLGIHPETIAFINAHLPTIDCALRVTVLDADGNPKPNKDVLLDARHGKVGASVGREVLLVSATDDRGRAEFRVFTHAAAIRDRFEQQSPGGPWQEFGADRERLTIVVGKSVDKWITVSEKDREAIREAQLQRDFTFTGHSFRAEAHLETLIKPLKGDLLSAAAFDLLLLNHAHQAILASALATSSLDDRFGVAGQTYTYETEPGVFVTAPFEVGPSLFGGFSEAYVRALILSLPPPPDIQMGLALIDPSDPPPGGGEDSISVGSVVTFVGMVAFGFVPILPDVIDAGRELVIKPLFENEPPNKLIVALAVAGLAVDAGYLAGPAGLVGNFVISVLKQVGRKLPPDTAEALARAGGTAVDGLRPFTAYVSNIPVSGLTDAVGRTLTHFNRVLNSRIVQVVTGQAAIDVFAKTFVLLGRKAPLVYSDDVLAECGETVIVEPLEQAPEGVATSQVRLEAGR